MYLHGYIPVDVRMCRCLSLLLPPCLDIWVLMETGGHRGSLQLYACTRTSVRLDTSRISS